MAKGEAEDKPKPPKNPSSVYIYYGGTVRSHINEKFPEIQPKDVMKKIGEMYGELTEDEKKDLNVKFEAAKKEYEKELKEYQETYGTVEKKKKKKKRPASVSESEEEAPKKKKKTAVEEPKAKSGKSAKDEKAVQGKKADDKKSVKTDKKDEGKKDTKGDKKEEKKTAKPDQEKKAKTKK